MGGPLDYQWLALMASYINRKKHRQSYANCVGNGCVRSECLFKVKGSACNIIYERKKMQGYNAAYQSVCPRDQHFSPPTEDWQPGNVILTKTNGIDKRIVAQISRILCLNKNRLRKNSFALF